MKIFNFNKVKNFNTNTDLVKNLLQESIENQIESMKYQVKIFKQILEKYEVTDENELEFEMETGKMLSNIYEMKKKIEIWEREKELIDIMKEKKKCKK